MLFTRRSATGVPARVCHQSCSPGDDYRWSDLVSIL